MASEAPKPKLTPAEKLEFMLANWEKPERKGVMLPGTQMTCDIAAAAIRALSLSSRSGEVEAVCDAFDVLSLSEAYGGSGATSVSSKDLNALERAVKTLRASIARKTAMRLALEAALTTPQEPVPAPEEAS